jgi:hypothetical protein
MSSFACTSCSRTFATRNGLSKHRTKCIRKVDDNDSIVQQTSENIRNYSNISEASQTDLFDFEEK